MLDKLNEIENRHRELEKQLSDPAIISNQAEFKKIGIEYKHSEKIFQAGQEYREILKQIADDEDILRTEDDAELKEMARTELEELKEKRETQEDKLRLLLIPRDENDAKNIILEIRAGTGGDESGLFAAELFRMYSRYAERFRWKVETMAVSATGIGGFKEVIVLISGEEVYSKLKFESGTHRVQRVPATESGGRIHTSAVTVAIMAEAEEVDVNLDPSDLRIDVYRSSGPGGQHVNTTDSAVRITHLPTNTVVAVQDEKSQHKNKAKAMKILVTRVQDKVQKEEQSKRARFRKLQVGTGDRSEKIRTYNFPQNRITDHRINYTSYDLEKVMEGELDGVIESLLLNYQSQQLEVAGKENE